MKCFLHLDSTRRASQKQQQQQKWCLRKIWNEPVENIYDRPRCILVLFRKRKTKEHERDGCEKCLSLKCLLFRILFFIFPIFDSLTVEAIRSGAECIHTNEKKKRMENKIQNKSPNTDMHQCNNMHLDLSGINYLYIKILSPCRELIGIQFKSD